MVHEGCRVRNANQASAAFVSTNSVCQGEQVPILWPLVFATGHVVTFAHTSFKWSNLASHNAGVTVVIVGISRQAPKLRAVFANADDGEVSVLNTENINAYLVPGPDIIVRGVPKTPVDRAPMVWGNKPTDGGNLVLSPGCENEAADGGRKSRLCNQVYSALLGRGRVYSRSVRGSAFG